MPYDGIWRREPASSPNPVDDEQILLEELAGIPATLERAREQALAARALYLALDADPRAAVLMTECDHAITLYACCALWLTDS